jgi:hypothetical protein
MLQASTFSTSGQAGKNYLPPPDDLCPPLRCDLVKPEFPVEMVSTADLGPAT